MIIVCTLSHAIMCVSSCLLNYNVLLSPNMYKFTCAHFYFQMEGYVTEALIYLKVDTLTVLPLEDRHTYCIAS